jgi:ATP-dependent protease HslVU (ClpYQ) peptidase subunit
MDSTKIEIKMTTIIGIQKDDHCILAADSRTTTDTGRPYSHPTVTKITKRGKFLIAGAGTTLPCDVVQYVWKPPAIPVRKDYYSFMITEVVPSIRACLKDNGYVPDKDAEDYDFIFLIALHGTIYELDDTLSVSLRDDGIYGIGSGASYAVGSIIQGATWRQALQIAARNDVYTAPPFISHRQEKI